MQEPWRITPNSAIPVTLARMASLHLQFHPSRASKATGATVTRLMFAVATSTNIRQFSMTRVPSNQYVNFDFTAPKIDHIWLQVRKTVLKHRRFGGQIRGASIIACTGSRGWENYKLLHHFDASVPLDSQPR